MKFNIIVCDPPWSFSDSLSMSEVKRGASSHYNTLTVDQIKNLPVNDIIDESALLALWTPSSLLEEGLDVMKKWGFTQKQTYIWVKIKQSPFKNLFKEIKSLLHIKNIYNILSSYDFNNILNFGMGHLFRQTHEICLIGINNNNIYKLLNNKSQRSVSLFINTKHSSKPEYLQNSLDKMFSNDVKKLEMFARRQRNGWTCIGNEVCNGEDIIDSIKRLKNI